MYQSVNTNRTRMKYFLLSATNIGSKELVIGSAQLEENITV